MALPINIEDLLNKQKVESNRLDLTEGRATSIPTIQKELLENGSPKATIETDESRSYFLIDIPCRKDFVQDDNIVRQTDIQRVTTNLMVSCPR